MPGDSSGCLEHVSTRDLKLFGAASQIFSEGIL